MAEPVAFPVCAWDPVEVLMPCVGCATPSTFLALLPRALSTLQPQGCGGWLSGLGLC